jgi:hypothetical protein
VPALAVRSPRLNSADIVARPLRLASAQRPVALWYRKSFPQPRLLEALAGVILDRLPDSVTPRRDAGEAALA